MGETEESTDRKYVVRTPGKFILTGEHAVVYGKLALAASVDLLTEIFLTLHSHRHPSSFVVYFQDFKFNWSLPLAELQTSSAGSDLNLDTLIDRLKSLIENNVPPDASQSIRMSLLALCFLYCSIVGSSLTGFELRITSTIPIGAGLGSSAAFSVGSSATFHLLRHLITSNQTPFIPDLEQINSWAFCCEKMFHATPSGIDNAVCTYGGVVKFQKTVTGFVDVPEARVLLVNTGVSRQTKLLVEAVRRKRDSFPSVVDPILDSIDHISRRIVDIIQQPSISSFPDIQVKRLSI